MTFLNIRILLVLLSTFFCLNLMGERKFKGISGNGGLSPDGKWYIQVMDVCLGAEPNISSYVQFEVVNLPLNKLKANNYYDGTKVFSYDGAQDDKSRPDFILYVRDLGGARYSDIIWDSKSKNVTVYFDSYGITLAFKYNTKNRNSKFFKMDSREYHKLKKNFRHISGSRGLFYIVPGSIEDNVTMRFSENPKKCKQGSVTFSVELLNTADKKITLLKWDKENIFNNFTIIAEDLNDRIPLNKVSKLDSGKIKKTGTFKKLDLAPKKNKLLKVPANCTLLPGKYKIQIYLTHYPAIHTKWHTISVSK